MWPGRRPLRPSRTGTRPDARARSLALPASARARARASLGAGASSGASARSVAARRGAGVPGLVVGGAVALALALGAGCGPSFQAIYEGDVRFEHCYALDENPSVALRQKSDCWTDWLQHYTYGQTRDRVVYATARARAMSQLGQLPTDEAMMSAAPGEVPQSGITAPAPTSAFAPPPKTLDLDSGVEGGAWGTAPAPAATWMSNLPPPPSPDGGTGANALGAGAGAGASTAFGASSLRPPGADCTESCVHDWDRCRATCTPHANASSGSSGASGADDAHAKPGCATRCDRTYKACLRGCAAK